MQWELIRLETRILHKLHIKLTGMVPTGIVVVLRLAEDLIASGAPVEVLNCLGALCFLFIHGAIIFRLTFSSFKTVGLEVVGLEVINLGQNVPREVEGLCVVLAKDFENDQTKIRLGRKNGFEFRCGARI